MAETYQVVVSQEAKDDINNILDFLQKNVSFKEAVSTRQAILDSIRSLERMPQSHPPVQEILKPNKPILLRQVVAKSFYRIIYAIEEVADAVIIIRVIHVKRGNRYIKQALKKP